MSTPAQQAGPFEFSGGALCLDLANTLGDRPRCDNERLRELGDLLRWAEQGGLLDPRERARLEREASRRPRAACAAFRRALAFREALFRVFSEIADGRRPARDALDGINRVLGPALRHLHVEATRDGFDWAWTKTGAGFDHVLWPVARSAAELLTSGEIVRIRECASKTCSWLFVDRSRTRRRRWCDMKTCGNRAKARRHYHRTRGVRS